MYIVDDNYMGRSGATKPLDKEERNLGHKSARSGVMANGLRYQTLSNEERKEELPRNQAVQVKRTGTLVQDKSNNFSARAARQQNK